MSFVTLNTPMVWPGNTIGMNATPGLTAGDTLDAAGEYTALVICAPFDMVVSHVGFKAQAVAGSPTGTISIETVTAATGVPSGTLWSTNTNVTTATLTTTFALHALTAAATITKGQMFAVVFTYASGTSFNVSTNALSASAVSGVPYRVTNVTGSAVKTGVIGMDVVLGSSTSAFYSLPLLLPAASVASNAFNNTSSARRGARFQVPFKCVAVGFRTYQGTAVGDYVGALETDAGAVISSSDTAFEGDISSALATALCNVFFDNEVELSPGIWYRLSQQPSSATNINIYTATVPSADTNYCQAWPGGANFYYCTFATSLPWTDVNTQVPYLDLLIGKVDMGIPHIVGG